MCSLQAVGCCLFIGDQSYFSENWNRLDGSLVIVGLVDTLGNGNMLLKRWNDSKPSVSPIVGKQNKIFGMLRLLRLFKVLKPLRVIHRTPGDTFSSNVFH